MDLILILIFLGLIVLGLFLININSNEEDKNIPSRLHKIAKDNKLNLDKAELSSNLLLGLDENKRKFLAIEPKNNEDPLLIDLHQYVECRLKVNESNKRPGKINFISLNLLPKNTNNKTVEIIFYDEFDIERRNRSSQMQMAKRWRKYLESLLK